MIALLAVLVIGAPAEAPPPKAAVVFLHLVPTAARSISTSALLAELGSRLEDQAEVEVLAPERAGADRGQLEACPIEGLYTCWFEALRPIAARGPRFLMTVVENDGPSGGAELALVLIDLDAAAVAKAKPEDFESRLHQIAFRATPFEVRRDGFGTETAAATLVDLVRPTLVKSGLWGRRPDIAPPPPPPEPPLVASNVYRASLYGGIAAVVVGAILTTVAIATSDDRLGCVAAPDAPAPSCNSVAPVTFGGSAGASVGAEPSAPLFNPGTVGMGLVGLGTGTAATTYFGYEPSETPWWAWAVGVAGGVLSVAVVAGVTAR